MERGRSIASSRRDARRPVAPRATAARSARLDRATRLPRYGSTIAPVLCRRCDFTAGFLLRGDRGRVRPHDMARAGRGNATGGWVTGRYLPRGIFPTEPGFEAGLVRHVRRLRRVPRRELAALGALARAGPGRRGARRRSVPIGASSGNMATAPGRRHPPHPVSARVSRPTTSSRWTLDTGREEEL
jgi:hypothetical protein